jgi:uncharacterized phage-associated protein
VAATSAAAVANEFLKLAEADPAHLVDPMKLQKLVYYAHAWFLAQSGTPLFEEDIEAWPWGPVIRNLYFDFKDYGRNPIVGGRATKVEATGPGPLQFQLMKPEISDPKLKDFIKQIWDIHKSYSGVQLSNATHMPGEPWTIIKDRYGSLDTKPTIPNEVIRDVFRAKT